MKKITIKPHQQKSLINPIEKPTISKEDNSCFVLSFKYLDRNQGQNFHEWQEEGLLADAMETLRNYCHDTLQRQCCTEVFKNYRNFPPRDKTDFSHPSHVPPDAEWASMHIKGKPCLAGHIVRNVFYIVLLDMHHRFYISEL